MNLTFAIIMATVLYKITKEKCIFARGDNYHCVKTIIDLIDLLCLTPLSAIFQLYHGDHFCGGGSRSTRREPPTMGKQLSDFYIYKSSEKNS
jgi:hypothetical protein